MVIISLPLPVRGSTPTLESVEQQLSIPLAKRIYLKHSLRSLRIFSLARLSKLIITLVGCVKFDLNPP